MLGLVALVIERVRALCFVGPIDVEPVAKLLREAPEAARREALAVIAPTFVGRALAPITSAEKGELHVALEESLADAKASIVARLSALRIGATLSTFLGFVGAAIALSWVHSGDHGLLGLDPARVSAIGLGRAALSIALGVGGSSFVLGSWLTLRGHAQRLRLDCERAVERALGALGS